MDELIETDVLVIGCGIAGSVTALQLADAGLHVTVVRRCALPGESSTYHAQGESSTGARGTQPNCSPRISCKPATVTAPR